MLCAFSKSSHFDGGIRTGNTPNGRSARPVWPGGAPHVGRAEPPARGLPTLRSPSSGKGYALGPCHRTLPPFLSGARAPGPRAMR